MISFFPKPTYLAVSFLTVISPQTRFFFYEFFPATHSGTRMTKNQKGNHHRRLVHTVAHTIGLYLWPTSKDVGLNMRSRHRSLAEFQYELSSSTEPYHFHLCRAHAHSAVIIVGRLLASGAKQAESFPVEKVQGRAERWNVVF